MTGNKYHHGNLRNMLVETGIEIISKESIQSLSLRKVAEKCGVSNAAPYAHFKNKEEFVKEMYDYVEEKFCEALQEITRKSPHDLSILVKLGETYVGFFLENPHYYYFLFSRKEVTMNFSLTSMNEESNPSLDIFKKITLEVLTKTGMPEAVIQNKCMAMWALVHGLANIATISNSSPEIDWKSKVSEIIQSVSIL